MEVGTTSVKFADQYSVLNAGMASLSEAIAALSERSQRQDISRAQRRAIQSQINTIKLKLARITARHSVLQKEMIKAGLIPNE